MKKNITLYDQFGRELDLAVSKKPDTRELAVAPILDSFRDYVTDGLTPERLASVFKQADAGDVRSQAELFELLEERDAHVLCERDKRRNVIVDLDYTVEPANDDSRNNKVAEFVTEFFAAQSDLDDILISLQDAVGKGFSSLELDWDVSEGQAIVTKFEPIKQKRFLFTDEMGLLSNTPRLLTDNDAMGVEIPAWKTIMHRYGGKSGSPARAGIFRVAAWMVLFKNYAIKDWVIFCELFGMPLRLGKYDQGATENDKKALFAAISSLGSDAAGVISKSTEIEFISASESSATSDLWKLLADFCNAEISKAILGQTLTAQVGDKGSYAASKTHNEVRLDLLKADGRAIASTIRSQLIRPLVGFNFGWDTPLPRYKAVYKEAEDLVKKADWITKLMEKGMPMGISYLRGQFSVPEPEKDEEMIYSTSVSPAVKEEVAKMVAKQAGYPHVTDGLTDKAMDAGSMDTMAGIAKKLLSEVESLEEFRDRLLETYADMDAGQLADVMEQSFLLADLARQI